MFRRFCIRKHHCFIKASDKNRIRSCPELYQIFEKLPGIKERIRLPLNASESQSAFFSGSSDAFEYFRECFCLVFTLCNRMFFNLVLRYSAITNQLLCSLRADSIFFGNHLRNPEAGFVNINSTDSFYIHHSLKLCLCFNGDTDRHKPVFRRQTISYRFTLCFL